MLLAAPAHHPGEVVARADRDDADRYVVDSDAVVDDLPDHPKYGSISPAYNSPALIAQLLGSFELSEARLPTVLVVLVEEADIDFESMHNKGGGFHLQVRSAVPPAP